MLDSDKRMIIKKFAKLVKCDVNGLANIMQQKGIFSPIEIQEIFNSDYDRHNRRKFFFALQKKGSNAFQELVYALRAIGEDGLAGNLYYKRSGAEVMNASFNRDELPPLTPITKSGNRPSPLNIQVVQAKSFKDTQEHNKALSFYKTRSKNRGRVLIINNYKFDNPEKKRDGAEIDDINLKSLFSQIGCEVKHCANKTTAEMRDIIHEFAQDKAEADICFVIVMSHGVSIKNKTYIYGSDLDKMKADDIIDEFTNLRCKTFFGKPKVFLFQVCRGDQNHTMVSRNTDGQEVPLVDSIPVTTAENVPGNNLTTDENSTMHTDGCEVFTFDVKAPPSGEFQRIHSDILIGNATMTGYTAHRDTDSGTWYIEAFCKVLQEHAFQYSMDEMLILVDDLVKERISENGTVQTPEMINRGFKKLYLHPGIYMNSDEKIEPINQTIH